MAGPLINTTDPTTFTSAVLIGDATGGSLTPPTLSLNGGNPVSAALEIQSILGGLLVPRMTTAQRNAIANAVNGMLVYNSTTNAFNFYQNGAWTTAISGGGINVPGTTTLTAVVRWGDLVGGTLSNSSVLISNAGAVTGVVSLQNGAGTSLLPSYTFTADTSSGMWQSAAGALDFSSNGTESLKLTASAVAINYLVLNASSTGNPITIATNTTGDANVNIQLIPHGTGSVVVPVGAQATPSIAFATDLTTGIYRSGAGTIDFSSGNLHSFQVTATAVAVNYLNVNASATTAPITLNANGTDGNISIQLIPKGTGGVVMPDGAVGTPGIEFAGDLTTGLYHSGAGNIDFACSGLRTLNLTATAVAVNYFNLNASSTTNPLTINANGTDANISISLVAKGNGTVIHPDGTAANPGIAFAGDLTTGLYHVGAGVIGFSSAGSRVAEAASTGLLAIAGTAGNPSYSFIADATSGMWQVLAGFLDFSANGAQVLSLNNTSAAVVNYFLLQGGLTGNPIILSAVGSDANISIRLEPQGTGGVIVPVGAVGTPGIEFFGDLTTGFYQTAAGNIDFACSGLRALNLTATAVAVNYLHINASATTAPLTLTANGTDTNISISLVTKGTGAVIHPAGAAATPSIVFTGDTTTGLYDVSAGVLGISCSGAEVSQVSAKGISLGTAAPTNAATNTISIPNGTAPTGMGANSIGLYSLTATTNAANCRTLGLYTDVTPVAAVAVTATDHSFPIVINGTTYYVPCKLTQN